MLRHVLATFSERSHEEELEYLNETLLWVTCADQPWTLADLEAILRLRSPERDGMIDLEGALRRQWASFFTLDREDGLTTAELENGSANLDVFDWDSDQEKQDEYESSDEDYFMDFNSKKRTTTVTFCHASIGDFLRDESEGKVSATLITNPEFATKANNSGHTLENTARNWCGHLLTTIPSKGSAENRREIVKMVLIAFRSEESMSRWIWGNVLALSTATIKAVRQWWQDQDVREFLSPEEKEFISTTEGNPVNLFKPMAMFCVKAWLREDLASPGLMASIVWRYQMLVKGEEVHDEHRNITAEEVIEAAEFGGPEKTSQWFQQCAIALRESGYQSESLHYFNKAMELNADNWRTLCELAQTYHWQNDWQKSIELSERARLSLLTTISESSDAGPLKEHLHRCLEHMGRVYEEQEDREKRFEVVQEAYQYAPSCWNCLEALLQYHNDNRAYEVTMELLKKLAENLPPEEDFSEFTQFFLGSVFGVDRKARLSADAALATDDLNFVLESLQTTAKAARTESRTLIAAEVDMAIARIYDELLFGHLKAIRCWENIMDTYSSSSPGTLIGTIRQLACSNLTHAFLCNAVEVGVDTPEAEESVARLEQLAHESQKYLSESCAFVRDVYLGIYYRLRGQDERAQALFRPSLQRSVQILCDDNPTNDDLSALRYILMRAGDFKNVVSIAYRSEQDGSESWYTCCGPCRRKVPTRNVVSIAYRSEQDGSESWYTCCGPCRRKVPTRNGFSICRICLEELCPDCVKLGEGVMPKKRCNSQHVEYLISIPPQIEEISGGGMLVDSKEMEFKTWLNQLKKEWALGDCKPDCTEAPHLNIGDFLGACVEYF
ncbi:NACHT and TPR domain protein [Penicillium cf. viridicatum]|uniref:NACHT and TPR domain protein n=1 Tax=Penicillium cf. viridicatum TaxID=2972119 RepID=A0A9W9SYM2_9EURO|nr:NACHT and TPR domain protein [Penicillium cf. viridicatum]